MKCPKKPCDGEMHGPVENRWCLNCGVVEGSDDFIDAVDTLLTLAAEEDSKDAEVGW